MMQVLLHKAVEAAICAGAEIMKVYSSDFDVVLKSDNSPLTIADKKANEVIDGFLKETNFPVISEENKQESYSFRKTWDTCWMVDPLDGTKEFINKNGDFTVNIALIKRGKPILGVIYVPNYKTLYYGITSEGKAYKCNLFQHEFTSKVFYNKEELKPVSDINEVIRVVGSRSHKSNETDTYVKALESKGYIINIVSRGSSLKFCMLAEGSADVYPRFTPTMEWDTAAGHAICNAVGLKVLKVDKSEELQYNKENLLNPFFIVQ